MVSAKSPNEDVVAERHAHLVATATDLLLKNGFHQTSVREIAAAANWNMGTLYRYISKKEDVLYLILESIQQRMTASLFAAPRAATAAETLRAAAERYYTIIAQNRRELLLLYRESASLAPEHMALGKQRELALRDFFADIIRWGIETGEFRPHDARLFGHTFVMLAHMWALKSWAMRDYVSADEYASHQIGLLMNELRPGLASGDGTGDALRAAGRS